MPRVLQRRGGAAWRVLALGVLVLLANPVAAADPVTRLTSQLRSDDFRVRAQAALALGASKSKRAVEPLCSVLGDSTTSVRAAAAAALGKLSLGGGACLKKRLADESSSSVKATIKKALALIDKGGGAEPGITAQTRYYVAIGKTNDKTGRNASELDGLVREAMSRAASALDGYAVAPAEETSASARKLFAKHKQVRGFYLTPKVLPPQYGDGNLTIRVEILIFTYPDKSLKGSLPVKLTQKDVSADDTGTEDELIRMAAERAIEKFSSNVERIQ